MDNPEKLATLGTQSTRRKQTDKLKNTIQYVLNNTIRKHTEITQTRHEPPTNN